MCWPRCSLISFLLASNWDSEIVRLRILRDDGAEALRQLDPAYPDDLGVSTQVGAMEAPLDSLSESIEAFLDFGGAGSGSNNWAVSGSRTRSGRPIVANDPHLSPALPPHWYLSHITTPEWEAAGASLVGTPGYSLGHNGKVAWGVTAGQTDNTDLFVEELRDHDRECRNPDGWGETETWTETIEVARARDVEIRLVRTPPRHGHLRGARGRSRRPLDEGDLAASRGRPGHPDRPPGRGRRGSGRPLRPVAGAADQPGQWRHRGPDRLEARRRCADPHQGPRGDSPGRVGPRRRVEGRAGAVRPHARLGRSALGLAGHRQQQGHPRRRALADPRLVGRLSGHADR